MGVKKNNKTQKRHMKCTSAANETCFVGGKFGSIQINRREKILQKNARKQKLHISRRLEKNEENVF